MQGLGVGEGQRSHVVAGGLEVLAEPGRRRELALHDLPREIVRRQRGVEIELVTHEADDAAEHRALHRFGDQREAAFDPDRRHLERVRRAAARARAAEIATERARGLGEIEGQALLGAHVLGRRGREDDRLAGRRILDRGQGLEQAVLREQGGALQRGVADPDALGAAIDRVHHHEGQAGAPGALLLAARPQRDGDRDLRLHRTRRDVEREAVAQPVHGDACRIAGQRRGHGVGEVGAGDELGPQHRTPAGCGRDEAGRTIGGGAVRAR